MDHMEFSRMLDNYEDLSDNDKLMMEAHAEVCEECRRELEFYRSIVKTAASLPVIEPPADLFDKINSRIDSMPRRTSGFGRAADHFRIYRVQYATVAACLAVGLIVGLNSGVIRDKLDPAAPDGVITTTTRVSDSDTSKLGDYELADDEPEATPAATERVVAQVPAVTAKPKAELPVATAKPRAAAQSAATARPVAVTAKPVTAAARPAAAAKPTASAAQPAATAAIAETPAAQSATAVTMPEAPAESAAPKEKASKSRYTIAHGNYYIPETAQANVEVTEEPAARTDIEIAGERYQIAMGSYEISEEEKKALAANKLIVNESDITKIIACMNSSWVRGANGGYTATQTAFANFLAKLDAEGIYYNYIQLSDTGSEVYFVLLSN